MAEKPRCYFCGVRGVTLKLLQFHVTVAGKKVLQKHKVCEACVAEHLKAYQV